MKEYCAECDIKEYCNRQPEQCEVAKHIKDIAEYEKAKEALQSCIISCIEPIVDVLLELIQRVAEVLNNLFEAIKEFLKKANKKVYNRAIHHKKKKTRKKNLSRLFKICKRFKLLITR